MLVVDKIICIPGPDKSDADLSAVNLDVKKKKKKLP
jgi:hypothetical protein